MKNHRFDRYLYMGITAVLVLAAATTVIFLFLERKAILALGGRIISILTPIIYGAVLAFLFSPVYNGGVRFTGELLGKKMKNEKLKAFLQKTVGTVLSLTLLYIIVVSLAMMIIPQLYSSIAGIVNTMPVYIQNLYEWLTGLFANNPPLEEMVLSVYQQAVIAVQDWSSSNLIPHLQSIGSFESLEKILGGVSNSVLTIFNLAKNILIGLIVMVYLLNIKDTLTAQVKKIVYAILPVRAANGTVEEFRYIHKVFSGFIIGKLIDSLIIGVLCFILMNLFKLPFALLISVIVGVTNVIPFLGPFIGAIPSAVLVFLISPRQCLYFVGLVLVLQQFDGNILGPKILGDSTGLSSFWVLFSILFFGGLWGFVGMIVAVPLTAVVFDLFSKFQCHFLRKKNLPQDTDDYMDLEKIDADSGRFIRQK